jgi:hypothetical protein
MKIFSIYPFVITFCLAFLSASFLSAQGWEILHEGGNHQFVTKRAMEASNQHLYIYAWRQDVISDEGNDVIIKIAPEGEILWIKNLPSVFGYEHDYYFLPTNHPENLIFEENENNNILIAGWQRDAWDIPHRLAILQVDINDGSIIQYDTTSIGPSSYRPDAIRRSSSSNILVAGTIESDDDDLFIQSYNLQGELQWEKTHDLIPETHNYCIKYPTQTYIDKEICPFMKSTNGGNYWLNTIAHSSIDSSGYLQTIQIDSLGNILNSRNFASYQDTAASTYSFPPRYHSVVRIPPNLYGVHHSNYAETDHYLSIFDESGTLLWSKLFSENASNNELPFSGVLEEQFITRTSNEITYASKNISTYDIYTVSAQDGSLLSLDSIPTPYLSGLHRTQIFETEDNKLYWFSYAWPFRWFVTKINEQNHVQWSSSSVTSSLIDFIYSSIIPTSDGGFFQANTQLDAEYPFRLSAIKIDSNGIIFPHRIRGNVFQDINNDCQFDTLDFPLDNWIISAEAENFGTILGTTNEEGFYEIGAPDGTVTVEAAFPGYAWDFCFDNPVEDSLTGDFDTLTIDFPLIAQADCPQLSVNLYTPRIRNCFSGKYYIDFQNTGTQPAFDAYLEITFHDSLSIDSASVAWDSQIGNTFTFLLDTIDLWEAGQIQVYFTPPCNVDNLGQNWCSEAHIYPDTICGELLNPYTGAFMEANAECQDSILFFYLQNTGQSPTSDNIEYVIIEDAVLQMEGQVPFDVNQQEIFSIHTDGSTYWLIAEQEPGAPGNSQPIIGVEGCAVDGTPIITTGILNQFPFNDADPYLDIDCPEVTGSYDPNDKLASPVGYGPEHFVEKTQGFDYTIRFQNTGNDTAFTVVIRDTLSPYLDILSVRPGLSSHPYEFEVYGERILKFTFNNILLPDSTTNEPESNGFVRFYVDQVTNNPNGTLIENNAGIYFDFNPPIITNTVWHTIGENYILINQTKEAPSEAKKLIIYPNPFIEETNIDIPGETFKVGTLNLYSLDGKLVRTDNFHEFPFAFQRNDLIPGIYFIHIQLDDRQSITGKLIIP